MKDDLASLPLNDRGEPVDWAHALAIIERLTRELAEKDSAGGRILSEHNAVRVERDRLRALLERWLETEQRWSFLGNETREALAGSPSN